MTSLMKFNLRDRFGDWWDGTSLIQRAIFRVFLIAIFFGLPFLNNPIIDTPNTSFESVLFYPLVLLECNGISLPDCETDESSRDESRS